MNLNMKVYSYIKYNMNWNFVVILNVQELKI